MNSKLVLSVAITALLLLGAREGRATEKLAWPGDTVELELSPELPEGLSQSEVRQGIRAAADFWNQASVCSAPKLVLIEGNGVPAVYGDGHNSITFIFENWEALAAPADAPGMSDLSYRAGESGDEILEADVYLNAESYTWRVGGEPTSDESMELATVLGHELGHSLGLEHPCEFDNPSGPECSDGTYDDSLMLPVANRDKTQASADDMSRLCEVYPGAPEDQLGLMGDSCKKHSDCMAGLACLQEICTQGNAPAGDPCTLAAECESSICQGGGCREACNEQISCPSGNPCDLEAGLCDPKGLVVGDPCTKASQCTTGRCFIETPAESYCTRACSSDEGCPEGWECQTGSDEQICQPKDTSSSSSCTFEPVRPKNHGGLGLLTIVFLLAGASLRRASSSQLKRELP